ncbi:MAG: NUDIX domain-containing protein [Patescibacteria group bacterium]|nr:NUDIX domain-containing protein [Patescibacteria group bacterium]
MKKIIFDKENENRPYVAANAVIFKKIKNKEHILLGKRKNVAGHNQYFIPGGHIQIGEKINDCLIREVKEETGLDVKIGRTFWIDENFEVLPHINIYLEGVLLDLNQKPKNLEPEKCYGWDWYPINNPPKPLWQTLEKFLEEYRKQKRILRFGTPSIDYVGVGVAGVILNEKNEVLLQLRGEKAKNERGLWKLPGGQIEYGETAENALKREIKEELGIEIKILKQIFCLDDILKKENQHWLVPFYLCQITKGKPKILEPEKAEKIAWFPINKLPKNLAFGTKKVLKKIKNNKINL